MTCPVMAAASLAVIRPQHRVLPAGHFASEEHELRNACGCGANLGMPRTLIDPVFCAGRFGEQLFSLANNLIHDRPDVVA